jgi:hypothetical protein
MELSNSLLCRHEKQEEFRPFIEWLLQSSNEDQKSWWDSVEYEGNLVIGETSDVMKQVLEVCYT